MNEFFIELLQVAVGTRDSLSRVLSDVEWQEVLRLSNEQAIVGMMNGGMDRLPWEQRPSKLVAIEWIGQTIQTQQHNLLMDQAVVRLYKEMTAAGIKIFVFKGQTLAVLYPDRSLRQCGDIDFFCYPECWEKAVSWLREHWGVEPSGMNTEKDVEFKYEEIKYEMHNRLTLMMYPTHSRYWERVVMKEILANPFSVEINGVSVPTLAPVYNALYVFVHIFQHLISDGIGLRQFIDWMMVLRCGLSETDVALLEKHLEGLGLRKAYCGLGAVLTDYLGLPEEEFPFAIGGSDHSEAPALMENIMRMGNFGQKERYVRSQGALHGLQHLGRIIRQSCKFGHYAPAEAWWRVPYMFKWWTMKLLRMAKGNH